ncbi:MAG: acetylglutamate kinase [Bacteroidaceae bacterium]|nr:acetylglutamate kinase [Bacteroidaceae bacterium]
MESITIVKVGGAIVENESTLQSLIHDFALLPRRKVLVHGGGRSATHIATQLGIESQMVGGRRITDSAMLDVVTMVYGGLVSKRLVALLQAEGVNALGLTGADMDVIRSHKRPLKKMTLDDGTQQMVDFGWVGDVDRADGARLHSLVESGVVPVMAPLTHDGEGHILNTNADTIAQTVATALAPYYDVTLTYCFEKPGVLRDANDNSSVIARITPDDFQRYLADGTISGGMVPKLENAFQAIDSGVGQVLITQASDLACANGTTICK